jgi:parallel beta-helix repeat protein
MKNLAIIALVFFSTLTLFGQTNVSGVVSGTWNLAGSPYIVVGSVTVNNATTLTVDSGVVVRFTSGQAMFIWGTLNATRATFTSSRDTVGGSPAKGDWAYIQVGTGATVGSLSMDNCVIKYGGTASPQYAATIYIENGTASLNSCDMNNSKNYGIILNTSANVTLTNTNISNCGWPISYNGPGSLVFNGLNNLTGNSNNGIYMYINGNANTLILDTIAVPYVFYSHFTVSPTGTLQVASSNILKFVDGAFLWVDGILSAIAGPGQSIYFTTIRNDNLGGDTNGDGTASIPSSSNWYGIYFRNESIDASCVLRRCNITYAGYGNYGGISMTNASPTIDLCTMANNYYGAMMDGVSNPVFTNNTIGSSQMTPIAMSFSCNPAFDNNTFSFSDNTYDAIGLLGGTLPADAVVPIRSVTSVPNVTYVLLGDVIVPAGRTLTINKGVVLKGINYWNRLDIQGKMIANGTADSMITITSIKDDNFGGDTNKDGTTTSPNRYDWGGILFETSSDSTSMLNYCRIKYGTLPSYGAAQIATLGAHPTISNCEIKDVVYGLIAYQTSRVKILNTTITNSQYTPIAMSVSADPTMSGLTFLNSGWTGLGLIGEAVGFNGTIKKRNVAGYTNITYVLLGDLTINSGTNVDVEPGIVLKMNDNVGIWVNGGFRAKGTVAGGEIIFTGIRDDNEGNPHDTNGDGQASAPGRGNWYTIRFQSTSDDGYCLLDSCQVKFSGGNWWGAVTYTDASSNLRNTTIINSAFYGVRCEGAAIPNVTNVSISSCGYDPIAMSLMSDPVLTNISFAGNGSQGIRLLEGTLSTNAYLRKRDVAGISNIAYIIQGLTISANAVLTIEPGVVIKNVVDGWNGIGVSGALVAEGTATQKIVFTSIRDDSKGGDTNNDGNSTTPERGYWFGIIFYASGLDTLNSLKNCEVRYGGSGAGSYFNWGEVNVTNCKLEIDSCAIEQSATSAIGAYGSAAPVVTNTLINNISQQIVTLSMFANPTFTNITAQNVANKAIGVMPETYSVTASIPKRDLAGYTNITYIILDHLVINSGTTITIPEGVVFKGGYIQVNGGLISNGTPSAPVVFTAVADDQYGNPKDTETNGFQWPSIWGGYARIYFYDVSDDPNCSLTNTIIRYTETGVYMSQASPTIKNCRFDRDYRGLHLNGLSQPVVDSCIFHNLDNAPMLTSILSFPSSAVGNIISGTTWRGIRIQDETLSQDFTLVKRPFAGFSNIPYIFGSFTVGTGAILIIEPGVVIKFEPYGVIYVRKGLIAEGGSTTDSTVVFTSIRDDFYGGDTNADSNWTVPGFENWSSIQFLNEALDPECRMKHCVVRYGGYYWNGAAGVYINSASPTITNCSFSMNRNGIYVSGASSPVINNCDIYQCPGYYLPYPQGFGVYNADKTFKVDARNNWWGDDTGPYHPTLNPAGKGVAVSDSVEFEPYTNHGSLRPKMGDVSLNGSIQAFDASMILKFRADSIGNPLTVTQKGVADVSGTGGITAYDASLILQYVVGMITTFPAEDSGKIMIPKQQQLFASSISIGEVKGEFGSTVTVPIYFNGVRHLASSEIILKYDPELFTVKDAKTTAAMSDMNIATKFSKGEARIILAAAKYIDVDGDALTLTIEIGKNIRGQVSSSINFAQVMLNEDDCTSLATSGNSTIVGKPLSYSLEQNYPNPFNPSTTIHYEIPDDGANVTINIYNSIGELVNTLFVGIQDAGRYDVIWNGNNSEGEKVGSGIYFYRLNASGNKEFTSVKKMLLVK